MRRVLFLSAYLILIMLVAFITARAVLAQDDLRPQIQLTRGEETIRVIQNAPGVEGAFILNARCGEDGGEALRTSTVYAPEPYRVETVMSDMLITSGIVLDKRPGGDQGLATLEILDGTLEIDEAQCPQHVDPKENAVITIVQGRTTTNGTALHYDNATGAGTLEGPVTLLREAEGEEEAVTARAGAMAFNVDEDRTLLRDNVVVESGGRVSEADEFEYDEAAGFAILRGSPASSRQGEDVVRGEVIEYDLVTNDVVVVGNVQGTLQFER